MLKDKIVDAVLDPALEKWQTKAPMPAPVPIPAGPCVLMWKQDPSVAEMGIRRIFLPRPG